MPSPGNIRTLQARRAAARRYGHPTDDLDRDYAAEKLAEYIKRTVEAAPPLSLEQRHRLAALLTGGGLHGAA